MRCPNCGQEIREGDKFCENCGAPAPLDTAPDPYTDPFGDPYGDTAAQPQPSPPVYAPPRPAPATVAPSRSFVTQAVITFVLYWLFWFPGLIANIIFWNESNRVERETGRPPDGKGCFVALFIVYVIAPILALCVWAAIAVAAG